MSATFSVATQSAFTLMEMTVVILIVALIAAAATLRVQGPLRRAQTEDIVEAIGQFDYTTRVAAREQDRPLRLVVDLAANELRRADAQSGEVVSATMRLPDGLRFEKFLLRGGQAAGAGQVPFSREGLTPSYALGLDCRGVSRWVLVAGLSGTLIEMSNEEDVRTALAGLDLRPDTR